MAVCLRMKYNEKLSFDAKKIIKQRPELRHKNRSTIVNNRVVKTVVLHHYVNNYFCKSWSINGNFNRFIMHHFSQVVNNNKNQIIVVAFPFDK